MKKYNNKLLEKLVIKLIRNSVKPTRAVLRIKSKSMFDNFGTCSKI